MEAEVVPVALKYDLAILTYSPLGGGVLAGKYTSVAQAPEDSRVHDARWGEWAQSILSEQVFALVQTLQEMAEAKQCTPSQLALAWLIQRPAVASAIIGPRTQEHLTDNLGALDVTFTAEELKRLDEASQHGIRL